MKYFLVLLGLVAFAAAAPANVVELLTAFDFDALDDNAEDRKKLFDCLLDESTCNDILKPIREGVVKVVKTKCAECNPEQREKYDRVMKKFQDKYQPVFKEFMSKAMA